MGYSLLGFFVCILTLLDGKRRILDTSLALSMTSHYSLQNSFDNQYDKDATYPIAVNSAQGLKNAMLERGAKIVLSDDIVVDANTPVQFGAYMFIANGREVTINLNGHDIVVKEDVLLKTNAVFTTANGGTLNIVGDGNISVENGKSGIFHAMTAAHLW